MRGAVVGNPRRRPARLRRVWRCACRQRVLCRARSCIPGAQRRASGGAGRGVYASRVSVYLAAKAACGCMCAASRASDLG